MAKTYHSSNQWALTGLFKGIKLGEDPQRLQGEAGYLVKKVNADDIAAARQTLVAEGCPRELAQKITATFLLIGLRKKPAAGTESGLSDNHIVQKILNEHAMTRCYLSDLREIAKQIDAMDELRNVSAEFRRLSRLVEYFVQTKKTLDREDDLIFPYFARCGWSGLCRTARQEHDKIRVEIDNLQVLITGFHSIGHDKFKEWVPKIVKRFGALMQKHLSYEQELLWPIARIVIDDERVWETIKTLSDEFDY